MDTLPTTSIMAIFNAALAVAQPEINYAFVSNDVTGLPIFKLLASGNSLFQIGVHSPKPEIQDTVCILITVYSRFDPGSLRIQPSTSFVARSSPSDGKKPQTRK